MSTPGIGAGPPPPVPRRHPSRPSLRSTSSGTPPTAAPAPLPLLDEPPERPPAARRPTSSIFGEDAKPGTLGLGYAGRVGLGSPRLEFFQRREGLGPVEDKNTGHQTSYVDDRSGLPSPPPTESDTGIPTATPRLRPRTPSTISTPQLPRSSSSATSHTQSSRRRLQPKAAGGMTRSSSSSSSVYSLSLRDITLPTSSGGSSGMSDRSRTPSPVKRASPSIAALQAIRSSPSMSHKSPSPSPVAALSRQSSRYSPDTVPIKEPAAPSSFASGSERRASASRAGAGTDASPLSRHPSRLSLGSYSSADVEAEAETEAEVLHVSRAGRRQSAERPTVSKGKGAEIEPESAGKERAVPDKARPLRRSPRRSSGLATSSASESESAGKLFRRTSDGAELDERIRAAEEKISRVNSRSSRPSTSQSGQPASSPALRHRESLTRHSPSTHTSPIVASGGTLRRSATLSSASARSSHIPGPEAEADRDAPEKSGGAASTMRDRDRAAWEDSERERSGGSAHSGKRKPLPNEFRPSGLFTPSPKQPHQSILPSSSRSGKLHRLSDSPQENLDLTSPSVYPRRTGVIDSPSSRFLRHEGVDGLDRSPSSSTPARDSHTRRQWSESLSGLPNARADTYSPNLPRPPNHSSRDARSTVSRSASVMDNRAFDDRRYQSRSSTLSSSSRLALTPGDSVSVVERSNDSPTVGGRKDPLEVLRRIEESRELHNRQWDEDRAGSVLGDFDSSPRRRHERPMSGDASSRVTPQPLSRPRPATSMSGMRDAYDRDAPRSAPVHRLHRRALEEAQLESPSARRATSRLSHGPPLTEPRQQRSHTSLGSGGRTSSLDAHSTKTEHGRLLLEAFRALELKLPPELLDAVPDLVRSLQAVIVAQESINSSVRDAVSTAGRTSVDIDLGGDEGQLRRDFDVLLPLLREAGRASDQSIRELTRVILDLPKLLREGIKLAGTEHRVAGSQSPTIRQSETLSRTSYDSVRSPEVDQRRWTGGSNAGSSPVSSTDGGGARERRSLDVIRSSSSMANFVSRFQRSPKKEHAGLPPIDQSPPREAEPVNQREYGRTERRNGDGIRDRNRERERDRAVDLGSDTSPRRHSPSPPPPPRSPERFRTILRKKASSTSTHTVRGSTSGFTPISSHPTTTGGTGSGSAFFPSPIRRTTTAVSQVTVGDISPPTRVKSLRSERSSLDEQLEVGSPVSRFSFQGRAGSEEVGEEEGEGEAVRMLAAAAKQRESDEVGTGTGRWRSGWSRRISK